MLKVMMVCLGNICRSPMAEAILRHKIEKEGLQSKIFVDSCGTANYHEGESPDLRTLKTLKKFGIETNHVAKQLKKEHLSEFDFILAMDKQNLEDIKKLRGENLRAKIILLSAFEDATFDAGSGKEVDDPYYGNSGAFERCYSDLEVLTAGFLSFLKKEYHF